MKTITAVAAVAACLSLTACAGSPQPSSSEAIATTCAKLRTAIMASNGFDKTGRTGLEGTRDFLKSDLDQTPWELKDAVSSVADYIDILLKNVDGKATDAEVEAAGNRMKAADDAYTKYCKK